MSDVNVTDHGSVYLFTLNTEVAQKWVEDNVYEPMWMGLKLAVEWRYAYELFCNMEADGLLVE
jgi:hypothetical protein